MSKARAEDSKAKVPAYIVTYSDMVTLLLTFFVMLLSLSTVQDPELFNIGRDSFIESLTNYGLGLLYGRRLTPNLGGVKVKHPAENPDTGYKGRTIDAPTEDLRRRFTKVRQYMQSMPSQITPTDINFSVAEVRFGAGESHLNEQGKKFLKVFCQDLYQSTNPRDLSLYVLGLCNDGASRKQQWIVSARRAEAVADFCRGSGPGWSHIPIYWWGGGPGGDWVRQGGLLSEQSQILIAVLRTNR